MANRNLTRAVRLALVTAGALGAGLYGTTGVAQEQLQEIIVTGSRIAQPNIEGTSPVTMISALDVKVQGVSQVEDLVNNLPQVFAGQGGNLSNGASGTATVNLRGLGSDRTLVLLNGKRMVAGSPGGPVAPDLNQIPAPLIERVEILTGGASAVYGSDAVAGVVNFIMKENFEGVQFDANYNFYNHSQGSAVSSIVSGRGFPVPGNADADGAGYELSLLLGSNFADGRGNATVFMGYRESKPLLQGQRDYSACALGSLATDRLTNTQNEPSSFTCGGSSTSFPGRFFSNDADGANIYGRNPLGSPGDTGYFPCGPYIDSEGEPSINNCFPNALARPNAAIQSQIANLGVTIADAAGTLRNFASSDIYNYGPLNYYQRPDERYALNAFAHYDVSDSATVYTEIGFHDDRTIGQIAPSGLFGLVATIQCDNPLLSADQVNQFCTTPTVYVPDLNPDESINYNGVGSHVPAVTDEFSLFVLRRNVEGGGRQNDIRHSSYRGVVGMRGTVGDNWDYDVSAQYSAVIFSDEYLNDFSYTRANRAMDIIPDPDTGAPVCRSVVDGSDPNCVPYNIWAIGGVTPEAIAYLQTPAFSRGQTDQVVISGSMSGDLGVYGWKSPWADRAVGVAFGAEYRDEGLELNTDTAYSTGDLFGQGGPNIGLSGGFTVKDLFLETRVPIAEGKKGAEQLTLNASYRYSDYSTGTTTNTYGVGLDWAPIEDFKIRGSYQRAVRAPNIIELFRSVSLGLYDNDFDPCAGTAPVASLAQCARTGVSSAQYGTILDNPAGQYNALFGGNPQLEPESADSYTFGIVFTPTFLDNFSVTVDFFNIKVENVISTLSPVNTLSSCLESGDPTFCSLITRDSLGTLWATPAAQIVATNLNLSTFETSGIDLSVNYRHEIGAYGSMSYNLVGTYLDTLEIEEYSGQEGGAYDCAGLYGSGVCGTPNPEWRHKFRATWNTPWNLDVSLTWRYYDKVLFERTSSHPILEGNYNSVDRQLDAQNYIDLAGNWTVAEKYTFGLGINNLMDDDPPLSAQVGAGAGNGNTFPQVYDAFGRYVFMSLSAKF